MKSIQKNLSPLKCAIVGLGVISKYYYSAILKNNGYNLVAVCDLDENKLVKFKNHNIYTTTKFEDLLNYDLELVIINLPNYIHYKVCKQFLMNAKHICCEKPLTIVPSSAKELSELSKQNKQILFTTFHRRYNQHIIKLLKRIKTQKKKIQSIRIRYFENIEEHCGTDSWYLNASECGGGVIVDNGTNAIDLAIYLMGKVKIISAKIVKNKANVDVKSIIHMTNLSGIPIEVQLDWE